MEVVNAIGRRKAAVARVFVKEGTGVITINKKDLAVYFPSSILQFIVKQPLSTLGATEKYDIKNVSTIGNTIPRTISIGELCITTLGVVYSDSTARSGSDITIPIAAPTNVAKDDITQGKSI